MIVGCLLALAPALFWDGTSRAEEITAESIVKSLTPQSKTRSLRSNLPASDAAFLAKIAGTTRGLGRSDRDQLQKVSADNDFPALDLMIIFDIGSFALKPEATDVLARLGNALRSEELAKWSFIVAGHTDARGTRDYNQELSERRAREVRNFLVRNYNINGRRLLPVGYGQEQLKNAADPLAEENRRVQIVTLPSQ